MTVVREDSYIEYTADGTQSVFTFDFQFIEVEDINVFINGVLIAETEYSIVADPDTGGYVQFTVPPEENALVLIARQTPATQETDYPPYGPFPAEAHELALDKLTMLIQESLAATDIVVGLSFKFAGTWQPNFGYTQMNIVAYGVDPERFDYYICGTNHQSGDTFEATFWNLLIDLQDFWDAVDQVEADKEIVAGYVQQTFEYMVRAENAAGQAELYRDQAQVSEGNAAASAQNATNCAASASDSAGEAEGHAQQAQLYEWEAEAERLTADSYATQDEDVPVDIYTSNGDGTFTATPTSPAEYSSFHWAQKAADVVTGVASITWTPPLQNTGDAANHIAQIDPAKVALWDTVANKLDSVVGTTDEIDIDNTDPLNPIISISPNFSGGGGGGGLAWEIAAGDVNPAEADKGYMFDTLAAPRTMTLPAAPTEGMRIGCMDYTSNFSVNKLTVNGNGKLIMGVDEAMEIASNNKVVIFVFSNDANGWRIEVLTSCGGDANEVGFSNPNMIINGDFQIWQRSEDATTTTQGAYISADRWRAATHMRAYRQIMQTADRYDSLALQRTQSGELANRVQQGIELAGSQIEPGRTYTFSAEVFSDIVCDVNLRLRYRDVVGSGTNQVEEVVDTAIESDLPAGAWKKVSFTFTAAAQPASTNKCMEIYFGGQLAAGEWTANTDRFIMRNVKLEEGERATPFIPRLRGEELALCQRYFYRFAATMRGYTTVSTSTALSRSLWIPHPVTMRVVPTLNNTYVEWTPSVFRKTVGTLLEGPTTTANSVGSLTVYEADAEL